MHGRKVRSLLISQHVLIRNYAPGDPTHDDAANWTDFLESIMRERGQKIPNRPTVPASGVTTREERVQDLEGTELMRRYFNAKQILEQESDLTGIWRRMRN